MPIVDKADPIKDVVDATTRLCSNSSCKKIICCDCSLKQLMKSKVVTVSSLINIQLNNGIMQIRLSPVANSNNTRSEGFSYGFLMYI